MWIVSYLGSLPRSRGALPGDREAILGTFGSGDHPLAWLLLPCYSAPVSLVVTCA